MSGIVLELQREALDKSTHVSDLLRKALLVARKLKVVDLETWILSELNGYSNNASVPEYRWIRGEIKAYNPYSGAWMPIMFDESVSKIHRTLTRQSCGQAIAEIENLASTIKDGQLEMHYPSKIQAKLIKAMDFDSPPVLIVSQSQIHGIIDTVRTTILDWALKLEAEGIVGDNLSFSDKERKAASHIVFNIGTMSNSQIQAETSYSQQAITKLSVDSKTILDFIEKARTSITELHLEKMASDELASELDTLEAQAKSPKPKNNILHESLQSVRTILEGAAGKIAADGLINVIKNIFI